MPAFQSLAIPSCPYKGDIYKFWNNEQPATGQASERIAVAYAPDGNPAYYSVQIVFDGDPGAFEIDIQESDVDAANDFLGALGGAVTTVQHNGTVYVARVDLNSPVTANFLRLLMKTQPANAVHVTATITRQ